MYRASAEKQELLRICRKLGDPKRVLEDALEKQGKFKRTMVAECCDRYIGEYRDRDSARTRDDATSKAGIIRETLGERYLDSLTERDIEEWRDSNLLIFRVGWKFIDGRKRGFGGIPFDSPLLFEGKFRILFG